MQDRMLRLCAIGLGVACIAGASVYGISKQTAYAASVSDRKQQITELSEELDQVSKQSEIPDEDSDGQTLDAKEVLRKAEAAGEKIQKLENEYMRIVRQELASPGEEAAFQEQQENIWEVFDASFGKDSMLRTPWYDGAMSEDSQWYVMANYKFSGTKVPVVWMLSGKDGLLAYVSATYDAATDTFAKPVKCITVLGNTLLEKTGSDTARPEISQNTSGIFSIIDQVNEGDLPQNRITYTEEEQEAYAKDNESRQQALDEMRKEQQGGGQ